MNMMGIFLRKAIGVGTDGCYIRKIVKPKSIAGKTSCKLLFKNEETNTWVPVNLKSFI